MKREILLAAAAGVVLMSMGVAYGQSTIAAKTTFGGGDGWLAPTEGGITWLTGSGDAQRGLAYDPITKSLLLANTAGGTSLQVIDPVTGISTSSLKVTGITGGNRVLNAIGVSSDGVVFGVNQQLNTTTGQFKVYRWDKVDTTLDPTVYYAGNAGLAGARVGDDFAAFGSVTDGTLKLAAGFGSSPNVAGNNSFTLVTPNGGTPTATAVTVTGPNAGDFRIGITFRNANEVWGSQGSGVLRRVSFSDSTGTFQGSTTINTLGGSAERPLALKQIAGRTILATLHTANGTETSSNGTVFLYDVTNPSAPVLQSSLRIPAFNTITGLTGAAATTNGNATGALAWGEQTDARNISLYALTTNQGIQAFNVFVPYLAGWNQTGGGTWNSNTNWTSGTPEVAGDDATFGTVITANANVTVDSAVSVKSIAFNSPNFSYSIAGPGKITLQSSGAGTTSSTLAVTAGNHTISAPIQMNSPTLVTVAANSSLTINRITTSNRIFNVAGVAGTVKITELAQAAQLNIGTQTNSPTGEVILTAVTGNLDITTAPLIVSKNFTTELYLSTAVKSWLNGGLKNGRGIGSSVAAADALETIGIVAGGRTIAGYTSTSSDLIVRYAYLGDTDLSGSVDPTDLNNLINGLFNGLTGWRNGDTNYDGVVDAVDYANLLTAMRYQGAPLIDSVVTSAGAVPEPAALGLLVAAVPLIGRRRR